MLSVNGATKRSCAAALTTGARTSGSRQAQRLAKAKPAAARGTTRVHKSGIACAPPGRMPFPMEPAPGPLVVMTNKKRAD
jgi:hypothetical protein